MTPDQVLTFLKRLGLSQRSGAKFLGMDERTMRKIVAADLRLKKAAEMLLRVMVRHKLKPADVESLLPKEKE